MSTIISELRTDHVNFSFMLGCLEAGLERVRGLDAADWDRLAAADVARPDPLFGPVMQREYRDLLARIRRDA